MLCDEAEISQIYIYGVVPPRGIAVAEPSVSPLHVLAVIVVVKVGIGLIVTVKVDGPEGQPPMSAVTV